MNEDKQKDNNITIPLKDSNTIRLYASDISNAHYLIHELFRIIRPLRYKYKLKINELIILNGIYVYHKLIGSSFTRGSIRLHIGYYNNNKIDYYLNQLLSKGYVMIADINKGHERYKLSVSGVEVCEEYQRCYDDHLSKFISKYNIVS